MSTTTPTGVRTATLPKVNLLPTEISEGARFRNLQAAMALSVVLAAVVVGGLAYLASGDVNDAQTGLASAQSIGTGLQAKVHTYDDVPPKYAQVSTADAQLQQAMSQELRYSFILNDLSLRMPVGVWIQSLSINQPIDSPGSTIGAWGSPQATAVNLTGTALNLNDVAGWLEALARGKSYTDPYVTQTALVPNVGTAGQWTFQSSLGITNRALSNRYTQKAGS
jgi:Tfp pilus assembly protein PilN